MLKIQGGERFLPYAQSSVQRVKEYEAVHEAMYEGNLERAEPGDEIIVAFYPSSPSPHGYPDLRICVTASADTNYYLQGFATGGPENWQVPVKVLMPGSTIIPMASMLRSDTVAPSLYPEVHRYDAELYRERLNELKRNGSVTTSSGYVLHSNTARDLSETFLEEMLAWQTHFFPEVAEVTIVRPLNAPKGINQT